MHPAPGWLSLGAGQVTGYEGAIAVKDSMNDRMRRAGLLVFGVLLSVSSSLIAHVAPDPVAPSRDGEVETACYQVLPPMLLSEYQEQQRTIEAQNARIAELEQLSQKQEVKIRRQGARLEALEGQRREFDELKQQTAHIAAVLSRMHAASAAKSGKPTVSRGGESHEQ
jgi:hypothetical protein